MEIRGPGLSEQTVGIVGPALRDLAARSKNTTIGRMRVIVLARTAFDVTPSERQLRIAVRQDLKRWAWCQLTRRIVVRREVLKSAAPISNYSLFCLMYRQVIPTSGVSTGQ